MKDDEILTVRLTAAEWNYAMALMGKQPFEISAELILKIRAQCMSQEPNNMEPTSASC
jgi:hypothetical protein